LRWGFCGLFQPGLELAGWSDLPASASWVTRHMPLCLTIIFSSWKSNPGSHTC
jgi:hypothetical protein